MVGDVTLAALARLGKLTEIVAEPWPRAQASVARGRNMLIIPLLRTPEREELYTWIAPVMELERAFFSLDEPVTSFAEARQRYRRIGVGLALRRSPSSSVKAFATSRSCNSRRAKTPSTC